MVSPVSRLYPPVILAASAALLFGSWFLTRAYYKGKITEARLELSTYRADVLTAQAEADRRGREMQDKAAADTAKAITEALDRLSGEVALSRDRRALASLQAAVEGLRDDATFACRQVPLPDEYLDALRVPR